MEINLSTAQNATRLPRFGKSHVQIPDSVVCMVAVAFSARSTQHDAAIIVVCYILIDYVKVLRSN